MTAELKQKTIWNERNGIIAVTFTSDGTTGAKWTERIYGKNHFVAENVKKMLRSKAFKPTRNITNTIEIVKIRSLGKSSLRMADIYNAADEMRLTIPNSEIACFLREQLSGDDLRQMGIKCIAILHKPIPLSNEAPNFRRMHLYVDGEHWLNSSPADRDREWTSEYGFAFIAPKIIA